MIIIFGGAFNPPTRAHFEIAEKLIEKFNPDTFYFLPVGNPAPPLPLKPDSNISFITSSWLIDVKTFSKALYPSNAMYSSIFSGSITPQFCNAILFCFL